MVLFDYLWEHTDNCQRCSRADWCDEGKRLLHQATAAAADALTHGVLARPPRTKA